jgi:hypothetical protein
VMMITLSMIVYPPGFAWTLSSPIALGQHLGAMT